MTLSIEELRNKIHQVDEDLVKLFCQRMHLATEIGRYKMESGQPIIDRNREEEVIQRVLAIPHSPVKDKVLEDFFRLIILFSREEQFKQFTLKENPAQ